MEEVFGSFYFRRTVNGNLLGEFANNKSGVCTESADRTNASDPMNPFVGEYNTSWQENGSVRFAKLTISLHSKINTKYICEWVEKGKKTPKYKGEGFLSDENCLIGSYKD